MIKDRGVDALVNECLIGPVLSMGATFIAYACALLAYLYLIFTSPEYNSDGAYTPVVVAFSFLIGLQICKLSAILAKLILIPLRQHLHHAVEQWYRYHLCRNGLGPRGSYARAPRPLPPHDSRLPARATGDSCINWGCGPSKHFIGLFGNSIKSL